MQAENYDTVTETPANFDKNADAVVIVHSVGGDVNSEDYKVFAKRIKQIEPDTNVLVIDWVGIQKEEAEKNYQQLQDGTLAIADLIDEPQADDAGWKKTISDWLKWGQAAKRAVCPCACLAFLFGSA